MIALTEVTLRRGGRAILDGVSLTAAQGEFLAVIGPNGAGKSTLLSVMAGLTRPDAGAVRLDGAPMAGLDRLTLARRRAYLPQNPVCEWPIPVERLVALGLTARLPMFGGLPDSFAPAIDKALADADLLARRHQPVTTLSGGELVRAMLARALVGEPDIVIVDEPVTGLDPAHAMDCMERLAAYAARGGLVVASLHDLTLAARHAGRIVAMKEGRIAAEGLSPQIIRDVFGVDACLRGAGAGASVDLFPARGAGMESPSSY